MTRSAWAVRGMMWLLIAAWLAGCRGSGGNERTLVLTGSSTVAPLASEIAKRFEESHPGVRVDVQTGGSSRGVNDALSGAADIGMVSRALHPGEGDLIPFTIANDGVGITLHRDNPVRALSDSQVVAIYTDRVNNWKEMGGRDAPITVINKAEGRSTLELFLEHFDLENPQVQADVVIGDNQQEVKTLVGNPGAIGYVSIGAAEFEAERGTPIKLLPLGGMEATAENVRNGSFPLSRPLNLVTRGEPTGLAKEFIDFARSAEVDDLVEAQFFVPPAR